MRLIRSLSALAGAALVVIGCDAPVTNVILDNHYPSASPPALVVYRAVWQAITFPKPVAPGASSEPQDAAASSANTAYVVIAPDWDPMSAAPPASFIVLQSRAGFAVHLDNTLHIAVDDQTFAGNCAAHSHLSQEAADFVTGRIFASDFASLAYDANSCTTTPR